MSNVDNSERVTSLVVETHGTRGSQAVSNPDSVHVGGNTTSLRIKSPCLPPGMALVIDTGTGFPPMARDIAAEGIVGSSKQGDGHEDDRVVILYTHYHFDHILGLTTAIPVTFNKNLPVDLIGPVDQGVGPKQMMESLFRPPFFPASYRKVASHFAYHPIKEPSTFVILIHPQGGLKIMGLDDYERLVRKNSLMPFKPDDTNIRLPLEECLVIRMLRTDHPQRAVSYRFDEMPTGKSFVFLTDNEALEAIPQEYLRHVRGVDFLCLDVQYDEASYFGFASGFGHAWAGFAIRLANAAGVKRLGTTHHDPFSTDQNVQAIVDEICRLAGEEIERVEFPVGLILPANIFACVDYGRYVV